MDSTKFEKTLTQNNSFKIFFAILWMQYTVLPFVVQLYRRLPLIGFMYQYIKPVLICVTLFFAVKYIAKNIKITDAVLYLVCAVIVCLHGVLYSNNSELIYDVLLSFLGIVVPFYFVGISYNHDELKDILYWTSIIGYIFIMSYQFYQLSIGKELSEESMATSYNILPSILVLINQVFETKRWRDALVSIIALISIFLFGTRGPILICFIFVILRLFFAVFNKLSFKSFSLLALILILVIYISSTGQMIKIANYLSLKFSHMGFSTRIFDMFIEGEISSSSGRNNLYSEIIESIQQKPILGYGFMGDRNIVGYYVHNFFLEIWCHFGIIFGTIVILLFLFVPIVAIVKSRNDSCFGFILALVSMVFIKLMLSGSYVFEKYLFFMLGLCVNIIRKKRNKCYKKEY